jgi:hypothetical protein
VRTLVRFSVVPALGVPICVALVGVGVQAAAFRRPPEDTLVAVGALRELIRYRVMRGTERIDRRSVSTVCVQGWFHATGHRRFVRGAIVLLGNGERLYDFGGGVRRVGQRGVATPADGARFVLAGCPGFLGLRVGERLFKGIPLEADPARVDGTSTVAIVFRYRSRLIDLYVDSRTLKPLELRLSGAQVRGWTDLDPGGGRAAIIRVRRAFGLSQKRRTAHA